MCVQTSQVMTAVRTSGVCVHVSELVTGVTARRCPLQMVSVQNNGCVYVSNVVTGVTTRRCPLQMTAVQNNGCVYVSNVVTGVTTNWSRRWVSPHTKHIQLPLALKATLVLCAL